MLRLVQAALVGHRRGHDGLGGSGPDRDPPARRRRHPRAHHRAGPLHRRPAARRQPRDRGSGPRAPQRRRTGRVLRRSALLPAQGSRPRARRGVSRGGQPRPRSSAGPDVRRRAAQPRARVVEHGRRLPARARLRRRLPGMAVRCHAGAGPDLPGSGGPGRWSGARQRDHHRGRPPRHRLRAAVLRRHSERRRNHDLPAADGPDPARRCRRRPGASIATAAWWW